jgi:predicted PurR-regulated permease PerM
MGVGLTALAQGTLLGLGFAFVGLPSPLVFGVLGVLFALIPLIGTIILWGPAALYLASQGEVGHAAFLAIWGGVVVSLVDNFLRPMLISGRTEVPTLAVFIGVMGGLSAFGFIGLFLGPIVLGLMVALLRFESEELAARRHSN